MKFLSLQKRGGGGCRKGFEVVLTRELEVLATVMGGRKKLYLVLRGGGAQRSFRPAIFPSCSPPVINAQSLNNTIGEANDSIFENDGASGWLPHCKMHVTDFSCCPLPTSTQRLLQG